MFHQVLVNVGAWKPLVTLANTSVTVKHFFAGFATDLQLY